ncbi:MAG: acylglycerol kinase family protein, partial [Chloroflexi bacterium]|nr:acylglycerol kinase family protein [Chloroflexota bacterium]
MAAPAPSIGFERKEAVLIINPAAHNVPALKRRREAEEWLREAGWRFRWEQTTGAGQATAIAARAAAEGVPLVLACGGDGTLNEVANGLAGTETALGTLPAGTSNIWAREAGISRKLVEAVRLYRAVFKAPPTVTAADGVALVSKRLGRLAPRTFLQAHPWDSPYWRHASWSPSIDDPVLGGDSDNSGHTTPPVVATTIITRQEQTASTILIRIPRTFRFIL